MNEIVLLGDSIFDNAAYVAEGEAVIDHLRARLPGSAEATLLARDGAVTADVHAQLGRIPRHASHLFLSAGGNDALAHIGLLSESATSMADALHRLAQIGEAFESEYRDLLRALARRQLPTTICTIYNGRLQDRIVQRLARTALTIFNDVILRAAFEAGLDVIDLRLVCRAPQHYANDIEPSAEGAIRIAEAIVALLTPSGRCSRVVVSPP